MKHIILATISEQWVDEHADRITRAKAKLQELGIHKGLLFLYEASFYPVLRSHRCETDSYGQ
ncbi:MAG: hypothetical protein ACREX9_02160 [Gammaproteobacteria bacterium]